MDRHHKNTHIVAAQACEQAARSFIRSALELCEKRIRLGLMDKPAETAMVQAVLCVNQAIETFLILVGQDPE